VLESEDRDIFGRDCEYAGEIQEKRGKLKKTSGNRNRHGPTYCQAWVLQEVSARQRGARAFGQRGSGQGIRQYFAPAKEWETRECVVCVVKRG